MGDGSFNLFKSLRETSIDSNTGLQQILDEIRVGGNYVHLINHLRTLKKGDPDYKKFKLQLPAVSWNAAFGTRRRLEDLCRLTGFLYFDMDELHEQQILQAKDSLGRYPYVVAVWISVGGKGIGFLVHVENITEANFTNVYKAIALDLGVEFDKGAAKLTQINIISYDPDIRINPVFESYKFTESATASVSLLKPNYDTTFSEKMNAYFTTPTSSKKVSFTSNNTNPSLCDLVIPSEPRKLVFSSTAFIDFGSKDYLVYPDGMDEVKVYWPETIKQGFRNRVLLAIVTNLVYLNPTATKRHLCNIVYSYNTGHCKPPYNYDRITEIVNHCSKLYATHSLNPITNKRYIVLNKNKNWTKEKMFSVIAKERAKIVSYRSDKRIIDAILNLIENGERVIQTKVAGVSGLSIATVKRHWHNCIEQAGLD